MWKKLGIVILNRLFRDSGCRPTNALTGNFGVFDRFSKVAFTLERIYMCDLLTQKINKVTQKPEFACSLHTLKR